MVSHSRKSGFPEFFANSKSVESMRRQFIDAPAEAARQAAFAPALEVAKLMGLLPQAFAASQQRELKRIRDTSEKDDPRIAYLEASVEQADAMVTMARRGEVRAKRSLTVLATNDEVFHGFVSDPELNPLAGLTVRLASRGEKAKQLSADTDADGYFRIPLGKRGQKFEKTEDEVANVTPEQIADLFARREAERDLAYEPTGGTGVGVQILKKGKVVHEDPVRMGLTHGSVYREYVIRGEESSSSYDFDEFVSSQSSKSTTSRKKATSKPAETTEVKAASRSAPTATRGKKKASRAKSTKRKS